MDSQTQMKQVVADAAIRDVKNDMILGLGSGSTAALMIKSLADEIRLGKLQNIKAVATSFQAEDGIRDFSRSRGLGDVYKRQHKLK